MERERKAKRVGVGNASRTQVMSIETDKENSKTSKGRRASERAQSRSDGIEKVNEQW